MKKTNNNRINGAKNAAADIAELFSDSITKCLAKNVIEKDGYLMVEIRFARENNIFDDMDKEVITTMMLNVGGFDDILVDVSDSGKAMNVISYYGGKPIRGTVRPTKTKKDTAEVLEKATWAMKEMYDCLCGMYSEQGEGFARTFVKDENKMMNTAEAMIPYMEALLAQVKK